ncbi:MAG: Rieske 2Fe-2S domain-containing protein [Gemmatimonadota bacterium]
MSAQPEAALTAHPDVLADADRLIAWLTAHEDPAVREAASTLLAHIDAVHRTALERLMASISAMAGDAFVNRLVSDPAVRLLFMSYDLLTIDRRLQAEEALDLVRSHLHAHGVGVELVDVMGGVVTVGIRRAAVEGETKPSPDAIIADITRALETGLIGFQELAVDDGRKREAATSAFFPVSALRKARRPVFEAACQDDIEPGSTRSVHVNGVPILIANADGELHAIENACAGTPLPLEFSAVDGTTLRCSWHGCLYDVRTGGRVDNTGAREAARLTVYPVRRNEGMVEVNIGAEPSGD